MCGRRTAGGAAAARRAALRGGARRDPFGAFRAVDARHDIVPRRRPARAADEKLHLDSVLNDKDKVIKAEEAEAGPGDGKFFVIKTDDNITSLEVGDVYRNEQKTFFKVTGIQSKGSQGGEFSVQRTAGKAEPDRKFQRVSGVGPVTIVARITLLDLYVTGGFFMHPIALMGMLVILLALNCVWIYRRNAQIPPRFVEEARKALEAGDVEKFEDLALKERGLFPGICRALADRFDSSTPEEIKSRAEIAAGGLIGKLRVPTKAVNFCEQAVNNDGGWRYTPKSDESDFSVTAWFLQALKTARLAQLKFDSAIFSQGLAYLNSVTDQGASKESSGAVGYQVSRTGGGGGNGHPALTAAGMMVRQFNGTGVKNHLLVKGAELTQRDPPRWGNKDFYQWYYATYAMHNMGGEYRIWWNQRIRDMLLENQSHEGDTAGSWDPDRDRWGKAGGRVYTTALGALCLEVYYRYSEALNSFGTAPDLDELFFE